ncbi:MAG: hypothetical protein ACRELX_13615 [Longimicrobiales bacterium]
MAGGLSPQDRQRLALLETLGGKVQHAHGLVERFAAEKGNPDAWLQALQRSFTQLKLVLSGAGFDAMAQQCAALALAARRGSSHSTRTRILREGIGTLRQQIDVQQRTVRGQSGSAKDGARQGGDGGTTPPPPPAP